MWNKSRTFANTPPFSHWRVASIGGRQRRLLANRCLPSCLCEAAVLIGEARLSEKRQRDQWRLLSLWKMRGESLATADIRLGSSHKLNIERDFGFCTRGSFVNGKLVDFIFVYFDTSTRGLIQCWLSRLFCLQWKLHIMKFLNFSQTHI